MNLLQRSMSLIKLKISQNPIEYKIQIGNEIIKDAILDIDNIANYDKALIIYDSMIKILRVADNPSQNRSNATCRISFA